ncbi:hypothetical protein AMJ86_08495, partial [bacterium SM23_57]
VQIWFLDQEIRRTPILVHGRLRAIGMEGDSIYFYSPVTGFGGIDNHSTQGTEIRLEYCVIDSIYEDIRSSYGHSALRHSRIQGNVDIHLRYEADTVSFCSLDESSVDMWYGGPGVFQHNRGGRIEAYNQQMETVSNNITFAIDLDHCSWTEICNNEVYYLCSLFRTDSYLHNNQIEGQLAATECNLVVECNEIGGTNSLGLHNIIISYCQGIIQENRINGYIQIYTSYNITIYKNLIVSLMWGIDITSDGNYLIQGNTIDFGVIGILAHAGSIQIVDNILQGRGFDCYGVTIYPSTSYNISYNDFYRVTSPTYECELDTGNIFLNPQFQGGYPFSYSLQANSPCIDAGDPTSTFDPDSTRVDMGAYYYDQSIDQPPALCSPLQSNVQVGTEFRYVARATDDYGPLQFGFWNLPSWLNIESVDWVADSAVVSGTVPLNQGNFTFGVWVEDGLSQRDSQEVSVLVSQYTILEGEVTGVLTVTESPYLVTENIYVPLDDSLRIEPGVELRFQSDESFWEPNLTVRGILRAIGTPQDSIRFIPEFDDTTNTTWGGIWFKGFAEDSSKIEYANISQSYNSIEADSQAFVLVKHTKIVNSQWGIRILNGSWVGIDNCSFYVSVNAVFTDYASTNVSNCYSVSPDTSAVHINLYNDARGTVQGCTFIDGYSCDFNYSSRVDFIDNTIMNVKEGIVFLNGASGVIANNRFINGSGINTSIADSLLITNNVFYGTRTGLDIYGSVVQFFVNNNIFLNNDLAIQSLYNLLFNVSYNDFFGNDSNFVNCIPDSTNIYLDPMIQDTIDFRLLLGSPCIDAGDPDPFFNDPDSTRNDIGCWGGPWGESYPYVPILSHQPKPIPTEFALLPPYPNPFNSVLIIPFTLPIETDASITIYNILGQKVHHFDFPPLSPGAHHVLWDASSHASGVYIIQLISSGKEFNQKALLLK